ncbi:hypothetical protein ACFFRR_001778 [Megaselia abdita]
MKIEYLVEQRKHIPNEGLPLVNFSSPTERKDIPIETDWRKRPWTITTDFPECVERNANATVREDDVWIIGQQKTGTTWMQEIVWLITHNFDFETFANVGTFQRTPNFEFTGVYKTAFADKIKFYDVYDACDSLESPRVLKSHLTGNMLPTELWTKKPKIIYMTRNVKDAVLSRYHMYKGFHYWKGDLKSFLDAFLSDNLPYLPYWPHIFEFWQMRNEPNVFFTSYETIKKDLKGNLRKICKFLEKPYTEELLDQAVENLSFEKMKNSKASEKTKELVERLDKAVGEENNEFNFYRKGEVGSFKEEFPEGYTEKLDAWSEKYLKEAGLTADKILNFQKDF